MCQSPIKWSSQLNAGFNGFILITNLRFISEIRLEASLYAWNVCLMLHEKGRCVRVELQSLHISLSIHAANAAS